MPYRPKDFALVKHDGLYHLFYIRNNMNLPLADTENDLGHAISADLWNWVQAPPVLAVRDTSWDRTHVWAPTVVERDGVYHMLYTGVSTIPDTCSRWQRTGLATSTDLLQWERRDAPVLACTAVPWTVCDSTTFTTAFRDPFVMPDPANPGQWLMYYSTYPAADSGGMVVGMARSGGDLAEWSDLGPLWITNRNYSYNDIVESAHLFDHDGLWYAMFTTSAGQPLSFATGPDPTGGPETWTYRGRLSTMLGVDTSPWYASEHFRDGLVDYFAFVTGDRIEIRRMLWGVPGTFALAQPSFMHVRRMFWGRDTTLQDSTETLAIVAAGWAFAPARLEALRVLADGTQVPVSLDSLGLPATVTLTGDTTRVAWRAAWLPDPADTTRVFDLIVRLTDQTASAPVLSIARRPALEVSAMAWETTAVAAGDTTRLGIVARHWWLRDVALAATRLRDDGTRVALTPEAVGLPARVGFTGDTTWVEWVAGWLPDDPDTTRLLRLEVRTADSSAVAEPVVVTGPERPLLVRALGWDREPVAEGDTAWLVIATWNGTGRSVELATARLRSDSTLVGLPPEALGFPASVALTGDTTRVPWRAVWLPDEPDTARLLRLVVRTADSSAVAEPLTVIGPEALRVGPLLWEVPEAAEGDTARLAIVAENWRLRSADLETWRLRSDGTLAQLPAGSLGFPASVPLGADTTWVDWAAVWLPDEPDTARLLRLVVRTADSSAVAEPLVVVGPEPVAVDTLAWAGGVVAEGDTARLAVVARNWERRSLSLESLRLRSDGTRSPLVPDSLALPGSVALTADTTWVPWAAVWLPEEPDTARLLRLVARTADSSRVAEPLVVVGPEPVAVDTLAWADAEVAEGDTARLAVVAEHWERRSLELRTLRLFADGSSEPVAPGSYGLPPAVALTADTTWVPWAAVWLPDDPDTTRLMRLVAGTADSSALSEPLVVVGPERPLLLLGAGWAGAEVAVGDTARLAIVAANWQGRGVSLEPLRLRGDSTLVALPADSLGFPVSVALGGDTTWVDWAAVWLPDVPDTARLLRLVVRVGGGTWTAEPLTVIGPEALRVDTLLWAATAVAAGDTTRLGIVAENWWPRDVALAATRLRDDGTRVALTPEAVGLPARVGFTGDTTWVEWVAGWLPDDPDTTRLLRLEVRTADSSAVAEPVAVMGPERPLVVRALGWDREPVAEGDTAWLAIATWNGAGRSVDLEAWRLRSDGTLVAIPRYLLELPLTVALTGDTTRVPWRAVWLPDEPDTARLLRLVVRTADSSAVAEPLTVVGPERPLYVLGLAWDREAVTRGETATLAIAALNWSGLTVDLRGMRRKVDKTLVPVSLDSLGLPGTVALTADTTRLEWVAVWLPDEPDTTRPLDLFLALADSSVVAGQLMVFGPAWPPDSLVGVPGPAGPAALRLESVYPSPSPGTLWACFTLAGDGAATLELADIAGRRVWRRTYGPAEAGRHVARLGDAALPGGVYFVRLSQAGRHLVARAVVLR